MNSLPRLVVAIMHTWEDQRDHPSSVWYFAYSESHKPWTSCLHSSFVNSGACLFVDVLRRQAAEAAHCTETSVRWCVVYAQLLFLPVSLLL